MSQFSSNLSSGHPTNKTEYHYKDLTMTVNVTVLIKLVIRTSYKQNRISLQGPDNDSQCHSSHQTCHQDILQIKQNITTRDLTVTVNVTVLTKLVIRTSYKQKQNINTRDLTMTVNVTVLTKLVIMTSYKQNRISLQGT